jgi:hypothetical protein
MADGFEGLLCKGAVLMETGGESGLHQGSKK